MRWHYGFLLFILACGAPIDQSAQTTNDLDTNPKSESECFQATTFSSPPVNLEKIELIEPLGKVISEHVTPIDHQYYVEKNGNAQNPTVEVYAPTGGKVTEIQHMGGFVGDDVNRPRFDDYRLILEHTCSVSTIFIHVDELSPKLMSAIDNDKSHHFVDIAVEAGEELGKYSGSVDFQVVDTKVNLNFISPELYEREPWKIHTPDPFEYFAPDIKQKLIDKSLRTTEPIGGKIDFDLEGKLVGNWFKKGTNGYEGANQERYWADHLAIVYDSIDTDFVLVSVGTFKGQARQFAVDSNEPDPAEVDTETGLVKYQLVNFDYFNGDERWDRTHLVKGLEARQSEENFGVILLQVLPDNELKVEIVPDKTPEEVTDFSPAALVYER